MAAKCERGDPPALNAAPQRCSSGIKESGSELLRRRPKRQLPASHLLPLCWFIQQIGIPYRKYPSFIDLAAVFIDAAAGAARGSPNPPRRATRCCRMLCRSTLLGLGPLTSLLARRQSLFFIRTTVSRSRRELINRPWRAISCAHRAELVRHSDLHRPSRWRLLLRRNTPGHLSAGAAANTSAAGDSKMDAEGDVVVQPPGLLLHLNGIQRRRDCPRVVKHARVHGGQGGRGFFLGG